MHTQPVKMWKDLSPEEKGALLLAHHEGRTIQYSDYGEPWRQTKSPNWWPTCWYRVKPEPKVEKKRFPYSQAMDDRCDLYQATHTISFNIVDGEVDCSSVKMEKR